MTTLTGCKQHVSDCWVIPTITEAGPCTERELR